MTLRFTNDASIVNSETGQFLFFSIDRFKSDIVNGDCCFICGIHPDNAEFNNEHILPDWILSEYKLHNRHITLPNGQRVLYGTYTIQCCKPCNEAKGAKFETPLSEIFKRPYAEIDEFLKIRDNAFLVYSWMALIFIKLHLKDMDFRQTMDSRKRDLRMIGEANYYYESLHHVHCLARIMFSKPRISPNAFGSFLCRPALVNTSIHESIDFLDSYSGHCMMLRIGGLSLFANFSDAGATIGRMEHNNKMISKLGALSLLQIREVFSHFVYCGEGLLNPPKFASAIVDGEYRMVTREIEPHPEFEIDDGFKVLAATKFKYLRPLMDGDDEALKEKMNHTMLYDKDGQFLDMQSQYQKM